jgi:hypothetical protein
MKKLLALAVLAVLAAPVSAVPLESANFSAASSFAGVSFGAFKFVPSPAALALRGAAFAAASVTVLDIERLYAKGAKVSQAELTGWFAGRRYSSKGAAAQLLVGADILRDADAGSLGGSDFKLSSMGGAEPSQYTPVDLYDDLGSELVNNVLWYIREEGKEWKTAEFLAAETKGQDKRSAFELRKSGDLLVAKYADGTYGYFFKKVR